MTSRRTAAAAAFVAALALAVGLALWLQGGDRATPIGVPDWLVLSLAGAGVLALAAASYGLGRAAARSDIAVGKRLAEDTRIISAANPAHRLTSAGRSHWDELVDAVNALAARYQALQADVDSKIEEARAGSEQERDRLAALMAQLTQAVVVCAADGRILLYNNSARQLLQPTPAGGAGWIGLGRSIYTLLDRNLIAHGLESLRHRIAQGVAHPVASFVASTRSNQLIRVQMGPVGSAHPTPGEGAQPASPDLAGFVLTLEDVTRTIEAASHTDSMVHGITASSRASIANIRAAVETIMSFPDMEPERRDDFIRIINEEVGSLGDRLTRTEAEYAASLKTQWSVEDIRAEDLLSVAQRKIEHKLGFCPRLEHAPSPIWLRVDSYSLVQAISYLASRLSYEFEIKDLALRLEREGRFVHLDLVSAGVSITGETWNSWESQPLRMGGEASPLSLKAILERHAGEIWYRTDQAAGSTYFRMLIPLGGDEAEPASPVRSDDSLGYWDVDPSRRAQPPSDAGSPALRDLAYTAIFIATTGPNPSGGDEIVSIGAVRIVDGRLLRNEVFAELVDPRRPISVAAARSCGIEPAMLEGRPGIEQVLPAFHRFCQGTVLVASNAALTVRFLRAKETRTGTRFTQPVLDPSRLFAISQATGDSGGLGVVAERLGVSVKSNAAALDLALATGEVFLKLIPLLNERGISTLKAVCEASGTAVD